MRPILSFRPDMRICGVISAILLLTLAAFIQGCDEDSVSPQGPAGPDLSLSIGCVDGAPEVHIANDGGSMPEEGLLRMAYEDGTPDSFSVQIGDGQSMTCVLSNLHGGVTVGIDGTSLSESSQDCLAPAFEEMLGTFAGTVDITELIPSPLTTQMVMFCEYDMYMENITHDAPVVSVVRIPGGMEFRVIYPNVTGDIRLDTSTALCVDVTGSITIGSIMYQADVMFDTEPGQPVGISLVNADMTITDLDIQIEGVMGFLVDWLVDFFEHDFATGLVDIITTGFNDSIEPLLSGMLVEQASCE